MSTMPTRELGHLTPSRLPFHVWLTIHVIPFGHPVRPGFLLPSNTWMGPLRSRVDLFPVLPYANGLAKAWVTGRPI